MMVSLYFLERVLSVLPTIGNSNGTRIDLLVPTQMPEVWHLNMPPWGEYFVSKSEIM